MSSIICHYLEGNLCMHPSAKLPNRQLPCVFKTYDDRISGCKHQHSVQPRTIVDRVPFGKMIRTQQSNGKITVDSADLPTASELMSIEEASKLTISTEPLDPIWGNETCGKEDCPSISKCQDCNWNGSV